MENKKIQKSDVITSLLWKFLESFSSQGIQFLLSIILARLLSPDDYGILALILVFIQLANVFIQSGFNTALIQKKDADDIDFSSIFYFSLFVSIFFYFLLFVLAPYISKFYSQTILVPIIRVLSITLFFGAIKGVQCAYVSKKMQFKKLFYNNIGAMLGSAIIGIILAYKGFGVWALVAQQLSHNIISCIILWCTIEWHPKLLFSINRIKELFSFSWKLLCSSLLDTFFRNIYNLIIGKIYDTNTLGFFNRGHQFPQIIATNLDGSIQSVMLPTLSANNDNPSEVKKITRRSISTSAFVLMPCMFGLAAVAKPLVIVLLKERWLPCVPFLQLACISYALYPIHTANLTGINALGRSDIFLKLEIIKKCVTVLNILITLPFGIYAMAIGQVIQGFISTFINAYPNKKLMGYSYFEQWKDLMPSFVLSIVMACIVWTMNFISITPLLLLIIQIIVGIIVYVVLAKLFKLEVYNYFVNTLKGFIKK